MQEYTPIFYTKNVPDWERVLRLGLGMAALAFAVMNWHTSPLAVGAGVVGAMLALSGLIGFCPACAMVGRKLDSHRNGGK